MDRIKSSKKEIEESMAIAATRTRESSGLLATLREVVNEDEQGFGKFDITEDCKGFYASKKGLQSLNYYLSRDFKKGVLKGTARIDYQFDNDGVLEKAIFMYKRD